MKAFEKNYLECRFYIIGDREVGKKSFIERLINIPCTSLIRNIKSEENFRNTMNKLLKINELSDEEYLNYKNNFSSSSTNKENTTTLKKINFESNEDNKSKDKKDDKMAKNNNMKFKSKFDYSPESLEEKKNKLMMKSLVRYQVISNRFTRPPVPEYPSKLYNVNKSKIIVKPYYIFPGEEFPDYYTKEDENTNPDYIIEGNPKITMKGVISDLFNLKNNQMTVINIDKLAGYKIFIYNFFIFLYDLSNFNSFEMMKNYFMKINSKLNITDIEDNCITCIIGNKNDKKQNLEKEEESKFNEFAKAYNNLYISEISTKPFFNFEKFFYELFFTILTKYHEKLFLEDDFRSNFESISLTRTTFSKGSRTIYDPYKDNPGPIYNLNSLYRYISPKELIQAFHSKKRRFNHKIFQIKSGPVFGEIRKVKDLMGKTKLQTSVFTGQKGGVINKIPRGYSMGVLKGNLNLMKKRKEMINEINRNIRDSIEGNNTLYNVSPNSRSKEQIYFDNVHERKKHYLEEKNNKTKEKIEKNLENKKNNLKILEAKEEEKKNLIMTKLNLFKSSSTPNMLSLTSKSKTDFDFYKTHLFNTLYPKNHEYLTKYNEKRNYITKHMPKFITPGPNAYNIGQNLPIPNKGAIILERRKPIEFPRADPLFPDYKDEFDLIVEKAKKRELERKEAMERNELLQRKINKDIKQSNIGQYNDTLIWQKWDKNKKHISNSGRLRKFLDSRKDKFDIQKKNQMTIMQEKKQIQELSRAISIQKGYGDPSEIKTINYSLVEDSSPKYTIKGRNFQKTNSYDDIGNLFLNESEEVLNAILQEQMTRPLPDFNCVRPRLPNIVFTKDKRFNNTKKYVGSENLFEDGIFDFDKKTQNKDSGKEPMSNRAQRTIFGNLSKVWPSPAEYRIKDCFDIIAEKGMKVSKTRDEIKRKEKYKNIIKNKEIS